MLAQSLCTIIGLILQTSRIKYCQLYILENVVLQSGVVLFLCAMLMLSLRMYMYLSYKFTIMYNNM